ncbi:MAG: hypothetical protein ACRDRS_14625 [Pseudonocardiaceae bacterium]
MPSSLSSHPLRDADGTRIPLQSRVEQVTVDNNHGDRLHQKGQVIGRDFDRIYVRFETDRQLIWVRPNLVRVIETSNYGY